ncbi:MAG: cysteine hydrolase family protein [Flavisolibacter sp.]
MIALLVVDAQQEFSSQGKRPTENYHEVIQAIQQRVHFARSHHQPIAWVRHFNRPNESPAFIPESWGAKYSDGCGPLRTSNLEKEFLKNVYGAFSGSFLHDWLENNKVTAVLLVGFYAHGCVSTTAREAIMLGYEVQIDPTATASCAMKDDYLGALTADEAHHSALLHLLNMGAKLALPNYIDYPQAYPVELH